MNSWNTFDAWAALRRRRPVSSWPRPGGGGEFLTVSTAVSKTDKNVGKCGET